MGAASSLPKASTQSGQIAGQLVSKGYLAVREASPCALCQKLQGRKDISPWAFQSSLVWGPQSEVQGQVILIFLPQ